jgi:phospholipid-binding lipoprotein MlaA
VLTQADTRPSVGAATVNTAGMAAAAAAGEDFDEDPFEGFNEKMFWFNREVLDRYLLKPLATGWDFVLPDPVQRGVHNFFDNLEVVRRVVNNSLQLKLTGAATELARFGINSTIASSRKTKTRDRPLASGGWGPAPTWFCLFSHR